MTKHKKIIHHENCKFLYKVADKIFEINDLHCKLCGEMLPYRYNSKDKVYYVRSCAHCQPKYNHTSPSKLATILGTSVDTNELYKYISKNRTKGFKYSFDIQSAKGKMAWDKVLYNHPELISTRIEYYLAKGLTKEEAYKALKERQTTFSLKKCIEKYGEEEGKKKWQERQIKWQASCNNKSDEELYDIRKRQMCNGLSYSKISQKLFNDIYNEIKCLYKQIYFATLNNENSRDNNEYYYRDYDNNCGFFFDFYVKELNKIIEFDGKYWHNNTKEKDNIRDKKLLEKGFKILRIKEEDYRKNPSEITKQCIEWIKNEN